MKGLSRENKKPVHIFLATPLSHLLQARGPQASGTQNKRTLSAPKNRNRRKILRLEKPLDKGDGCDLQSEVGLKGRSNLFEIRILQHIQRQLQLKYRTQLLKQPENSQDGHINSHDPLKDLEIIAGQPLPAPADCDDDYDCSNEKSVVGVYNPVRKLKKQRRMHCQPNERILLSGLERRTNFRSLPAKYCTRQGSSCVQVPPGQKHCGISRNPRVLPPNSFSQQLVPPFRMQY